MSEPKLKPFIRRIDTYARPDAMGGGWGIEAIADLRFRTPEGGYTGSITVVTSGIWGIDDPDADYVEEFRTEQVALLADMLLALGVNEKEILEAVGEAVGRRA